MMLMCAALPLAGCGEEAKSVEYYKKHLTEAREKAARCQSNGDAGDNCGNAAVAIQQTAREQFERDQDFVTLAINGQAEELAAAESVTAIEEQNVSIPGEEDLPARTPTPELLGKN
jgi:hypothetical protein